MNRSTDRHMWRDGFFGIVGDTLAVARVISSERGIRHGAWYFIRFRTRGFWRFLLDSNSVVYARALRKPVIHVIGDSHAKVFRRKPPFVAHHLGAATAHNLGKASSTTSSNRKLFNIIGRVDPRRDIVLLAFGEIDCRIHIYYHYEKNQNRRPIVELIDDTISNSGGVLGGLRELGVNFLVLGVPPATAVRNEYRYPFYASPEVHSRISRMFNERLAEFCRDNGYGYIDVHSGFSDGNGFMLKEYAADEIHLNGRVVDFVRGELNARLGIRV